MTTTACFSHGGSQTQELIREHTEQLSAPVAVIRDVWPAVSTRDPAGTPLDGQGEREGAIWACLHSLAERISLVEEEVKEVSLRSGSSSRIGDGDSPSCAEPRPSPPENIGADISEDQDDSISDVRLRLQGIRESLLLQSESQRLDLSILPVDNSNENGIAMTWTSVDAAQSGAQGIDCFQQATVDASQDSAEYWRLDTPRGTRSTAHPLPHNPDAHAGLEQSVADAEVLCEQSLARAEMLCAGLQTKFEGRMDRIRAEFQPSVDHPKESVGPSRREVDPMRQAVPSMAFRYPFESATSAMLRMEKESSAFSPQSHTLRQSAFPASPRLGVSNLAIRLGQIDRHDDRPFGPVVSPRARMREKLETHPWIPARTEDELESELSRFGKSTWAMAAGA